MTIKDTIIKRVAILPCKILMSDFAW